MPYSDMSPPRHKNEQLVEASSRNDVVAVRGLLRAGADPNATSDGGVLPLDFAASWGYSAVVELLLSFGASPRAFDPREGTALHGAAQGGWADTVAILLRAGAEIDRRHPREGATALHLAMTRRSVGTLATLLAWRATVDCVDCDGCTPLDWLDLEPAACADISLSRLLAAYGATRGGECMMRYVGGEVAPSAAALLYALYKGHLPSVSALLAAGAPVTAADDRGYSALSLAAGGGRIGIVRALLRAGATVRSDNSDPLWHAVHHGHGAVIRELLCAGAEPGPEAMVAASRGGDVGIVRRLLAAGADPNGRGGEGTRSALEVAVCPSDEWSHGHPAVVRVLVDAGALFTERTGATLDEALELAAEVHLSGVPHPNLREMADLDRPDDTGWTPLMWAAHCGRSTSVQTLLELGVDAERTDSFGRTAEDLAAEAGWIGIAASLRERATTNLTEE
jgi:ankyrin repeat protein